MAIKTELTELKRYLKKLKTAKVNTPEWAECCEYLIKMEKQYGTYNPKVIERLIR